MPDGPPLTMDDGVTGLGRIRFLANFMATILVDQSYKIEQTSHDTAIAAARGTETAALVIDRRLKRMLVQEFGKRVGGRRIYLWLFAYGASEVIFDLWQPGDKVVVDTEYEGSTQLVEDLVATYLLRKHIRIDRSSISSSRVGRHSLADSISRMPWLAAHKRRIDGSQLGRMAKELGLG